MIRSLRGALVVACLLVAAQAASAQTQRLLWDQPGVVTLPAAQALIYTLKIDTAPAVVVVPTCTVLGAVVSCSTPLAALVAGVPHTLTLTVDNGLGFGTASATIGGISPVGPANMKISITTTFP
jgi:hypothetical protein